MIVSVLGQRESTRSRSCHEDDRLLAGLGPAELLHSEARPVADGDQVDVDDVPPGVAASGIHKGICLFDAGVQEAEIESAVRGEVPAVWGYTGYIVINMLRQGKGTGKEGVLSTHQVFRRRIMQTLLVVTDARCAGETPQTSAWGMGGVVGTC